MSAHPRMRSPNWRTRAVATTAREVQVQRFRVEVVSGPNRGQVGAAEDTELAIGTAPGNQLVVTDPTVSRHHAVISATGSGFQLRDLGSTNGTCLAGYRVDSAYVESGALIQIGETTVRFDALEERVSHPLSEGDRFGDVLGQSPPMRRIFGILERVVASDTTILLDGETGTGKGAIAETIHRLSGRASGPFMVIDCGAIPPNLIESELFGHERGAFTGAEDRRIGAFEAANGGTIFLDEIGELGADLQPKLLRVLEGRQVRRIGSVAPIPVDVRVIAATNRDLRHEVNSGAFRTDLFYRLNVMRVTVPPLRERREDIPMLVAHFYRQLARSADAAPPAELIMRLMRQPWAGNVRELRSAVERAILLGESAATDGAYGAPASRVDNTWPEMDFTISFRDAKENAIGCWTRLYVRELVDRFGGNLSRAARAVSMDRNHLRDLLNKYANGAPSASSDRASGEAHAVPPLQGRARTT
jgi:DNA-binding NtrC family response regulator